MGFVARGKRSKPVELVLYRREGCHLCEEMRAVVDLVLRDGGGIPVTLREVDISRHPDLEAAYGEQIPVLLVNGRKAFKFRLTEEALRERLRRNA
ncbi:MAG TPA: glutaredoxin family protein [Vicinamibacteria bacterium]|nr:glutaredoxin family protein [Vicinamibacteria bacterium]